MKPILVLGSNEKYKKTENSVRQPALKLGDNLLCQGGKNGGSGGGKRRREEGGERKKERSGIIRKKRKRSKALLPCLV